MRVRMVVAASILIDALRELPGVETIVGPNAHYFFYDPDRNIPHDRRQPFATLITGDEFDGASDLAARGLHRLNLGVSRETYRALFGPEPAWNREGGPVATGHDFTQRDTFLPHPVYAPLSWICILEPSEASWPRALEFIHEAHALARSRHRPRPTS